MSTKGPALWEIEDYAHKAGTVTAAAVASKLGGTLDEASRALRVLVVAKRLEVVPHEPEYRVRKLEPEQGGEE